MAWFRKMLGGLAALPGAMAMAGDVINIDFHLATNTAAALAPGVAPTNQGLVVNTATATWNSIVSVGGVGLSFTNIPLNDDAGLATPATLSGFAGFAGTNNYAWAAGMKDTVMMEGWYGLKTNEYLAISNLPAAFTSNGYSVTVFGDVNATRTMNYTVAGITRTISDASAFAGNLAPFTVLFAGLTNSSFVLTGNPNAVDARSAVNGLRIIANTAPAPRYADAIGVNFHYDASGAMTAGDVAGLLPMAGWNNYDVGGAGNFSNIIFTNQVLQFSDGATSDVQVSLSVASGYIGASGSGAASSDRLLYSQYLSWTAPGDAGVITFSNLPPALASNGYDVVVHFDADQSNRTFTISVGGRSAVGSDYGMFTGAYVRAAGAGLAANYARFSGLTGTSFTIGMRSDTGRGAANGVQIVPHTRLPPDLRIEAFAATPARITNGATASLRWSAFDATTLSIGPALGDVTAQTTNGSGSCVLAPATTTVYRLIASNTVLGTAVTAETRVAVGPPVPNLLVFLVDDMGWQDTSVPFQHDTNGVAVTNALNLRYRTPSMERLAASGMKFTAAYAAPVCTPTRCAIMTGKNTARHRVTNWTTIDGTEPGGSNSADLKPPTGWSRAGLPASETNTLPRLLAQAGYRTIHAGKGHFGAIGSYGQYPQSIGFEVNIAGSEIGNPASYFGTNNFGTGTHHVPGLESYHGSNIFLTEALTREMNAAIGAAVSNGAPFFAYLAHYAVHTPWQVDPRFATNYSGLTGNDLAFATLVEGMDRSLGDILDHLATLGVAENTLVCFLSDNGGDLTNGPLRNKKGSLFEGGVRVPMLWSWAKSNALNTFQAALPIAAGSRQSDSVLAWDLFPTLLGRAGLAHTNDVDGHDLSGYLRGEAGAQRPQQFAMHFPHARYTQETPSTLWRDGAWKLIYDYQDGSNILFNLADDMGETNDLAAAQPERLLQMTRDMARELQRLGALFPERITNSAPVPPAMPYLPALDLDQDGVNDVAEDLDADGLMDPGETDPANPDTDGDGTSDGPERRIGTDPLNAASRFAVRLTRTNGTPGLLSWPSGTGTAFRIERSPALFPAAWTHEAGPLPGASNTTSFLLSDPATNPAFYRVLLE